jgi:putative transposase
MAAPELFRPPEEWVALVFPTCSPSVSMLSSEQMNTVKIYQLKNLSSTQFRRLREAQMEAAQVWNCCMETHKAARLSHEKWPERNELQKATKGRFALHSQSVQMVVHAFLANVDTTRQLRQTHPTMNVRYPYKSSPYIATFSYFINAERGANLA